MRLNYIDNCDCLEGLKEVPDKSVDAIITDPPYFLSMGHAGCKENAFNTNSDMVNSNRTFGDLTIAKPFFCQLFREFRRVLKPDGAFYFFTDWRGYAFYFPIMAAELPVRNLIVWDKLSVPGSYYTFAHELIIFGTAAPKLLHKGGTNVWRMKAFSSGAAKTNGTKVHPTQKPVEIISKMIEDSSEVGGGHPGHLHGQWHHRRRLSKDRAQLYRLRAGRKVSRHRYAAHRGHRGRNSEC